MSTESARQTARIALEDGAVFEGVAFGATKASGVRTAEVVFNTAMTGYQEALTDPSYEGQILVMTAPMIGNYGVNDEDVESSRIHVAGFIIRERARRHSNYRATTDLSDYLNGQGVLGIEGIDTRALTRRLRTEGAMRAAITADPNVTNSALVEAARSASPMTGQNLAATVGCEAPSEWTESLTYLPGEHPCFDDPPARADGRPWRVLALDCGAKRNIFRNLLARGCAVTVAPHGMSASDIGSLVERDEIDGVFISNGPGDPAAVDATISTLRDLLSDSNEPSVPTFGICLGHQLLGLALGASTYKLKFGHHGANQPVRNEHTGRVEITSQNHGFAIDPDSLAGIGAEATHINLNDGTIAGFRLSDRPVFAVQHHPEASPGPHDAGYVFDVFIEMMRTGRPTTFSAVTTIAQT